MSDTATLQPAVASIDNRDEDKPRLIEQGDPCSDPRAFRRCLGQYPTGVSVITARLGDQLVGMAVNSFAAVSLDPPMVLWSIRRESASAPVFLHASHFGISVLSSDQVEISRTFGASHPDRFALTDWAAGQYGSPLIKASIAHLECRRAMVYEGGDHWILVGQVEHYARFEGEPLLFSQGQYAAAQSHPSMSVSPSVPSPCSSGRKEPTLLGLLNAANHKLSTLFEEHRRDFGVTVATGRVLNRLSEASLNKPELERATYLGEHALEDALRELIVQGLVAPQGTRFELTAAGAKKRDALSERAADFAVQKFQHISDADIATVRRVLTTLQG